MAVTTFAGLPLAIGYVDAVSTEARFWDPMWTAADDVGNLFIADGNNRVIRKLDLATGAASTLAGAVNQGGSVDGRGAQARFWNPGALAIDHSGNLFVADTSTWVIRKVVLATADVTTIAGSPGNETSLDGTGAAAGFSMLTGGMVADASGNLFVADGISIRKVVLATREVTTIAGGSTYGSADGIGSSASFSTLGGLVLDRDGNLLVQDWCTLRKIVPSTGQVTTVAGTADRCGTANGVGSTASLSYGFAMVFDRASDLLIADYFNNAIRKVALATNTVTTLVGIVGRAGVILGSLPAGLNQPRGLARGSDGTIYILDEGAVLDLK